mmetsp:Transcript_3783/g.8088  ORF Transcript_3783/g.8088 Transcript_3783/m.8088 type:complete len:206 (+) Transcript_3783:955-1572(+)
MQSPGAVQTAAGDYCLPPHKGVSLCVLKCGVRHGIVQLLSWSLGFGYSGENAGCRGSQNLSTLHGHSPCKPTLEWRWSGMCTISVLWVCHMNGATLLVGPFRKWHSTANLGHIKQPSLLLVWFPETSPCGVKVPDALLDCCTVCVLECGLPSLVQRCMHVRSRTVCVVGVRLALLVVQCATCVLECGILVLTCLLPGDCSVRRLL